MVKRSIKLIFVLSVVIIFGMVSMGMFSKNSIINMNNSLRNIIPGFNNDKYVILTFDDSWSSQYEAYKIMKPLDMKGTLYINSGFIGQKDRLSLDNLKEMYDRGWDISNHTVHHVNLTEVTPKKAYDEIYGCSSWIAGHGFTRDRAFKHFAYPEGGYNEDIKGILKEQNILTARTTNPGNSTGDLLELGRSSLYGMTDKNIRDKILSDEKLLILSFHRIVPDNTKDMKEIDIRESSFKNVLKSIIDGKRKVLTITGWYRQN